MVSLLISNEFPKGDLPQTLADAYELYRLDLQGLFPERKAYAICAKLKTALLRFTLQEWGFLLKLDGDLIAQEVSEGLELMRRISVKELLNVQEAQESVFKRFGDKAPPASRRVYRSSLKQFKEWSEQQVWWKLSVCATLGNRTPSRQASPRQAPFRLNREHLSPALKQALRDLQEPWLQQYTEKTAASYIDNLVSHIAWLHYVKGIPLQALTLHHLVPMNAWTEPAAIEQVVAFAKERVEWLRQEQKVAAVTQAKAINILINLVRQWVGSERALEALPLIQALQDLRRQLGLSTLQPKTTNRTAGLGYSLKPHEISLALQGELEHLIEFLTDPGTYPGRQDEAVSATTAQRFHRRKLLEMLGWLHRYENVPLEELSLTKLVYTVPVKTALEKATSYRQMQAARAKAKQAAELTLKLAAKYTRWLRTERKAHPHTEVLALSALLAAAKNLYCEESDYLEVDDYFDIPVIKVLRKEIKKTQKRAEETPSPIDESKKWLDWAVFLNCVRQLKEECKPLTKNGRKRSERVQASSLQRYLVFALLALMPTDRQRTLRELELGRTLIKGEDNRYYIQLGPGDCKTSTNGLDQSGLIPEFIYPELELWLTKWRPSLNPKHNFVFTQLNGKPFSVSNLTSLFKSAAYRLTGQATTPHLVRAMLITYLKQRKASNAVMVSLADAMHNSVNMQNLVYDRRQQRERVELAEQVVLEIGLEMMKG